MSGAENKPEETRDFPMDPTRVTRRQFIRQVTLTGAAIAAGAAGGVALWQPKHNVPGFTEAQGSSLASYAIAPKGPEATMAIAHGTDIAATVRAAIGELGGMSRFIQKGDIVVLKPNVAFDRPAALAATTHPEALRAVAMLVKEAGAREIRIADSPINAPAGCFMKSGIAAVANDLGMDLYYPDENSFAPLSMNGEVLKNWTFFEKPFRGAHKVIGVAPCKDHNLCSASMTTKNWYGLLGGRRNQFHQHIHSIVSDFTQMMKPTLVVLDGMNVLMSNGPTGGRLSDVKKMGVVVAGTDMVAVDSYGYQHLLERDIANLTYLHKAHGRGLGNIDWKAQTWREVQV